MDLIKKLNSISIDDLKNIDVSLAKEWLLSRPGTIINGLLIFITVVVVYSFYTGSTRATQSLQLERTQLQEKMDAVDKFKSAEMQYARFVKEIQQPIEADELIAILSEFAIARNVRILSFSPAKEESNNFVSVTSVEINVGAEDYANIVLFMHDIERAPYSLRIGNLSGQYLSPDQSAQQSARNARRPRRSTLPMTETPEAQKYIQATIRIESVELKDV